MLITFSGLDGAGKSTLIAFLQRAFEARERQVVVLHLNDEIGLYAYLRMARDRLRGRPTTQLAPGMPDPRSQKDTRAAPGVRGWVARVRTALIWNKPLRRLLYPLDLLVFLCYRMYFERARSRVVIMDRYFYDTLVDVTNGRGRFWTGLLAGITPTPTVPVFLDITPDESFRRKREFSIEYLRRRADVYHEVFARVPRAVTIVNDDLETTKAALLRAVGIAGPGR